MCPGSDIDLLFLHPGLSEEQLGPPVAAVLYPLWDEGIRVSHAVRTPAECAAAARHGLSTLTGLLDIRLVAGDPGLVRETRVAASEVASANLGAFRKALLSEQRDRDRSFGTVWRTLEPDLKEGVGGLRDVQVVRWLGAAGAGPQPDLDGERAFLLRTRTALHLVAGVTANRLFADHQSPVASALGYGDAEGWEARDALMRELFEVARAVHVASLEFGAPARGHPGPRSVEELLRGALTDPDALRHPLALHSVGSFPEMQPAWSRVRGRPQRDPYHRYPVDVHLLETVAHAATAIREPPDASPPDDPVAAELAHAADAVRASGELLPLLVGALLHDAGKVGLGSHVGHGVEIAGAVLDAMDAAQEVRHDVLFLVREHLLLSDTATRRDVEDEDVVLQTAARIGDQRRLAMLYLLTLADAHATGPSASTPWRLALIRDLVAKVRHVFEHGLMDRGRAGRLELARATLRGTLMAALLSEGVDDFLEAAPPGYLLWVDPKDAPRHVPLVLPRPARSEIRVDVVPGRSLGTYWVAIGAVDRLGLLSIVAGSFALAGLTILSAQAFTNEGGIALDVFEVRGAFEEDVEERRWDRFRSLLQDAVSDPTQLAREVGSLRSRYPPPPAAVPVEVRVDLEASDFFTVIEVDGPDRLGLLFDLARTFADHGLDVHVAKVATYGPRVVDVFYVRDEEGQRVEDPARIEALARRLSRAASARPPR